MALEVAGSNPVFHPLSFFSQSLFGVSTRPPGSIAPRVVFKRFYICLRNKKPKKRLNKMAIIIDGKRTAQNIRADIAQQVEKDKNDGHRAPHLVAVLVGNNGASVTYVNNKVTACREAGFLSTILSLPADVSEAQLLEHIESLNNDRDVDGFIVQLPLPKHIDEDRINLAVNPEKDVDGFHPVNVGKMTLGLEAFVPATPSGVLELMKIYQIPTRGKNAVVIGRSNIVGTPMAKLLSRKGIDATVTVAHSHTQNIEFFTKNADIIVTALGVPNYLKASMIKEGATVIDVGITRLEDPYAPKGYKIVGDVDFKDVFDKAGYITPVPGGVGPMTIAMLLKNTLMAARNHRRR